MLGKLDPTQLEDTVYLRGSINTIMIVLDKGGGVWLDVECVGNLTFLNLTITRCESSMLKAWTLSFYFLLIWTRKLQARNRVFAKLS